MDPRTKESLLWGVIGALSFLVLLQGYELLTEATVSTDIKLGVALLVGIAATLTTYLARDRLLRGGSA